jgi:hypothetical protein
MAWKEDDVQLIGIDCATEDKRTGVALAEFDQSAPLVVKAARVCSREESAVTVVRRWLDSGTGATLLALDAPLGWPRALSAGLAGHRAGAPLPGNRKELFWRDTDWVVKQRLGVRPLSVGADLIAHTAHAALELLGPLGLHAGSPVIRQLRQIRIRRLSAALDLMQGLITDPHERANLQVRPVPAGSHDVASLGDHDEAVNLLLCQLRALAGSGGTGRS